MNKLESFVLGCAFILVLVEGYARAELPREIRVVTYNIHHGEGVDRKFDLPRIAKAVMAERRSKRPS